MVVHPDNSHAVAEDLVYADDLTGLRNRRFLYAVFGEGWSQLTEAHDTVSLAIVDLDYFKQVNDTHGHLTGDLVLSETATLIEGFLADKDRAIRYGGDEFVLLLPNRSKAESGVLVESLRRAMADKEFVSKEEKQPLEVMLSFSMGVATYPEDGATGEELMTAADKALYLSKRAGRNRVTLAGELSADLEDEIDCYRTFPSKTVVGRQDLIETLVGVCELLGMGTGTWTALSGPAGIGKSRILREGLRLGPEAGVSCVLIELSEDMAGLPHAGIGRLLTEVRSRQPEVFDRILEMGDAALRWFLSAHISEVASLLEGSEPLSTPAPDALRKSLVQSFRSLSQEQKWLFLIDDVANLDPHSSELLRLLIEEEKLPMAVISAHRSDLGAAESGALPGVSFLQSLDRLPWFDRRPVPPLSKDAVSRLTAVLLPRHHAPSEFADLVFDLTAGNPLFLEEVLRIGIATRRITRRGGEWFVQPLKREDLPTSLDDAIARRMALLDTEVAQDIARASAIGTTLTPELLQALLGKNEGEVLDFVDKARSLGFVAGGQQGDLSEIRFASSAFRDHAYQQMDATERTRAHREIGKIEEHRAGSLVAALASRLAYHFERGEVYEKARIYLEAARSAAPPILVAGDWDEAEVPVHRRRRITEAAVPLPEEAWASLDDTLRALAQATKSLWMYPEGSPIADAAFRDLHQQLEGALLHSAVISLAAVEGILVVNGVPYPSRRQEFLVKGLVDQFNAREIRGFTIRQGIAEHEVAFLVSQLASDEPVERDPVAWEAILEKHRIENVDFGDRVYVPAEGVAGAPVVSGEGRRQTSGVIRVASLAGMEELTREWGHPVGGEPGVELTTETLQSLLEGLEAEAAVNAEIQSLVPAVAGLLRRLLRNASEVTRNKSQEPEPLADTPGRAHVAEVQSHWEPDREPQIEPELAAGPVDAAGTREYLEKLKRERDPVGKRSLLGPAEERFRAFVEVGDLAGATTVLRFIRQCRAFDDEEGELAQEGNDALASIASGETLQLLLSDLLASADRPDPKVRNLLLEIGQDAGDALVTFVRETDDLRARRLVARLLKEIGGTALDAARASITHGDNPVVARRVISVLDRLSPDLAGDLSTAVQVRNPGVLGEAVKVVRRQPRSIQAQVIASLLASAAPEMVRRGVYYLGEWNLQEAGDSVLSLLRHAEDLELLGAATAAVARMRLPGAVPILGEMLGRKQVMGLVPFFPRGLRREFARALAAIGTVEARARLAEFAKDVDSEVRNIARGMPAPTGA